MLKFCEKFSKHKNTQSLWCTNMKMILFIFLFFISQSYAESSSCNKKDVIQKTNIVNDNLKVQISNMQNLLVGNVIEGYTVQSIFGSDFKIEKTKQRIAELDNLLKENKGITVENQSLNKCLLELNLNERRLDFTKNSNLLVELKIKLLQKNLSLSDSIRESSITDNLLPSLKEEIGKDFSILVKLPVKNTEVADIEQKLNRVYLDWRIKSRDIKNVI
jgi:hypothetical protein